MRLLLSFSTTILLLLCTEAANAADPMLLAETGGFLLGNAYRCNVSSERIIRAGNLIGDMMGAVSQDASEKDAADARFAEAFLLSSKLAAKEIAFSPPCDAVVTQFERLERIKMRLAPIGTSEIADETRRLVKSGTLRGVSIGFMPKPGRMRLIDPRDPNTGWRFDEIELLEVSLCSVQANRESMVIGKSYRVPDAPGSGPPHPHRRSAARCAAAAALHTRRAGCDRSRAASRRINVLLERTAR